MAANERNDERIQAEFRAVQDRWRAAAEAHRMAPPDAGFSARLAGLAEASRLEAEICRTAHDAGYAWPPSTSAGEQPYELRPGTGRRGPEALWHVFDAAVAQLTSAAATTDLIAVADAYDAFAGACAALSKAVEREDGSGGLSLAAHAG
jgi:hypothetical protein